MAAWTQEDDKAREVLESGANPNRASSEARTWLRVGQNFMRMLRDPHYHFPGKLWFVTIIAVMYVISPIDIIPELIFGPFGVVDDLGFIMLVLKMIYAEIQRYSDKRGL